MTRIQLRLDKNALSLAPGEAGDIEIALTNAGGVVDSFVVSVEGLPPAIYAITGDRVSLFPGKSESLWLRVQIPAGVAMPAGDYSFQVRVASVDDPTQVATADVAMEVLATGGLSLGLEPQRVAGRRGLFELTISNGGNSPAQAVLDLTDTDEALRYTLGTPVVRTAEWRTKSAGAAPAEPVMGANIARGDGSLQHELEVPPGGSVSIPLLVTPRKRRWTGKEILFSFEARAHPPGVEWEQHQAQAVRGELAYRPILAFWYGMPAVLHRALPILLALIFLGVLLFLLFRPTDTPLGPTVEAQATQTALAAQNAVSATLTALAAGGQNGSGNGNGNGTGDNGNGGASGDGSTGPSPDGIPSIQRFWLDIPATVEPQTNQGQPNLQYDITAAQAVTIEATTRSASLRGWESSSIVDYQLTAVGERGTATDTLSVMLVRPPSIGLFAAEPITITEGSGSVLQWEITGARSGTVNDNLIADLGATDSEGRRFGTLIVTPPGLGPHPYVFCASNDAGRNCRSVIVYVVLAATPVPPTETPTNTPTPLPPSATPTPPPPTATPKPTTPPPPPTNTSSPAAPTPTQPPPPTNTPTPPPPTSTPLPAPTNTLVPPTSTNTATSTNTPMPPTPTNTPTVAMPSPTPACYIYRPDGLPKSLYSRTLLAIDRQGVIADVNVHINGRLESRQDSLKATLHAPNGTSVVLMQFRCNSLNESWEFDYDLDDEAEAGIHYCDLDYGWFKPERPLSLFDGMSPTGTWVLVGEATSGYNGSIDTLYQARPAQLLSFDLEICLTTGARLLFNQDGLVSYLTPEGCDLLAPEAQ